MYGMLFSLPLRQDKIEFMLAWAKNCRLNNQELTKEEGEKFLKEIGIVADSSPQDLQEKPPGWRNSAQWNDWQGALQHALLTFSEGWDDVEKEEALGDSINVENGQVPKSSNEKGGASNASKLFPPVQETGDPTQKVKLPEEEADISVSPLMETTNSLSLSSSGARGPQYDSEDVMLQKLPSTTTSDPGSPQTIKETACKSRSWRSGLFLSGSKESMERSSSLDDPSRVETIPTSNGQPYGKAASRKEADMMHTGNFLAAATVRAGCLPLEEAETGAKTMDLRMSKILVEALVPSHSNYFDDNEEDDCVEEYDEGSHSHFLPAHILEELKRTGYWFANNLDVLIPHARVEPTLPQGQH